ncbi:MAG: bifunctional riboflavin kinase/FAD synthetase [Myxococcales bacterium]|nr:bifunctional riboflavin kinase/FAD synthetase [Myxococcales bacterium]
MTLQQHPLASGGSAIAFGNFDGVHIGHRMLIDQLRAVAAPTGQRVTVITFEPHPLRLLRPDKAPLALDTLAGRTSWLHKAGVDQVVVLPFDEELRDRSATWFAEEILFSRLDARAVIASDDSRFGRGGKGDIALLRRIAASHGARVLRCPAVSRQGEVVSSSRIRRLVTAGEIPLANKLLGRPYALRGRVVHGDARGRQIGFPTANIETGEQVRPSPGVYVGRLEVDGELLDAVCNLGTRPTLDGSEWRVEAHLLDWSGDLYDREVSLHLVARLRGERRFAGLTELSLQIAKDCEIARSRLG